MLISIIIPVYNASKYIQRCIKSIIEQTYEEWECILIDDGSTDNSFMLLKDIQKIDDRFIIIHQNNCGAGIARNTGINVAKGEYIVFIDIDDYINKDYLKLLSLHTEDVVFIEVVNTHENGYVLGTTGASEYLHYTKDQIIRYQMTGELPWAGWRKAVKTNLLNLYHIRFSNHHIGEEALYSFKLLYYASEIGFILQPVYNHVVRVDSLSRSFDEDPWGGVIPLFLEDPQIFDLLKTGNYLNSLNLLNIRATILSIGRLALYYPFRDYKIKANIRIEKYRKYLVNGVGFGHKSKDFNTLNLYKMVLLNYPTVNFLIVKIKSAIIQLRDLIRSQIKLKHHDK